MKQYHHLGSFYLRLALGATMLSAVADRFGFWGAPGEPGVAWGNWENFAAYSAELNSFMPLFIIPAMGVVATALEIIFSLMLITGFKTKYAAFGVGCLLTAFALAITISSGIKGALDYSVFIGSAAGFFLSTIPYFKYSIDELLTASQKPNSSHNKLVNARV